MVNRCRIAGGSWLVAAALLLAGCATARVELPRSPSRFSTPAINESSGLVQSRKFPGLFWTHNDSGDEARLFVIRRDGSLVSEVRIDGARSVDWESITADDEGNLYIGDIGNNANRRRDLVVYRIAEPDPKGRSTVPVDREIRFRYAEQRAFPDPRQINFDAEALFWADGNLYLLTKHRSDTRTVLYRFPSLESDEIVDLIPVGEFDTRDSSVTGAEATADGRVLAVLTYTALHLFERRDDAEHDLSRPVLRIDFATLATKQCEGVAWDGDDVVFTNEQGEIHRIIEPLSRRPSRYP